MEQTWVARTVRPIVAAGVAVVFLAFMAMAWFVFGSSDAVRALAGAMVAALVALTPSLLARVEYRATEAGLERRRVRQREGEEFVSFFAWGELGRLVPTRTGFKYYKNIESSNPWVRAWKLHVLSGNSGEVHVEEADQRTVHDALEQRLPRGIAAGDRRLSPVSLSAREAPGRPSRRRGPRPPRRSRAPPRSSGP